MSITHISAFLPCGCMDVVFPEPRNNNRTYKSASRSTQLLRAQTHLLTVGLPVGPKSSRQCADCGQSGKIQKRVDRQRMGCGYNGGLNSDKQCVKCVGCGSRNGVKKWSAVRGLWVKQWGQKEVGSAWMGALRHNRHALDEVDGLGAHLDAHFLACFVPVRDLLVFRCADALQHLCRGETATPQESCLRLH